MTDHKSSSWLWKKKSSEKTVVAENNEPPASIKYEQEIHVLQTEKAELEKDLNELNNKLSSILVECEAKDELAKRHSKTAQEALSGWEKAEAKALSLRQELNEAIQQKTATEEENIQLDTSLKECTEQLRFTREDQERRMHEALVKVSDDFEESRLFLEHKLAESNKTLDGLAADNAQLHDELLLKDRLLEELNHQRIKADADFSSLISRLESVEKENGSLRYEVRVLEKEVDFRNEEREFNRRSTDATHKQHLENVKKIAKLESECQKLRVLVRKRLPGPAAVAKMKNQVQMLERDPTTAADLGRGRRKAVDKNLRSLDHDDSNNRSNSQEIMPTEKKINALTEQISALEDESKGMKEMLLTKSNQLQTLRNMYSRTALKLSQTEAQLEDSSSRGQAVANTDLRRNSMDLRRSSLTSHDIISEIGSNCDDKASSCAGSWTSALISELEQFKGGRKNTDGLPSPCKSVAVSDISLMDDFAEMEKLAIVCVDKTMENNSLTHNNNNGDNKLASRSLYFSKATDANGKELIPNSNGDTRFNSHKGEMQSKLHTSISRLIEIIEGISNLLQTCNSAVSLMSSPEDGNYFTCKGSEDMSGFMVRIVQWKVSELSPILQSFHHVCDDVLNGKTNIDVLIQEMTPTLEWIVNHCFSLQDVSSMKDAIKKHFDSEESRNEGELDIGTTLTHVSEAAGTLPCLKEELVDDDDVKAEEDSKKTKDGSCNVEPSIMESEQRVAPAIDGRKPFTNDTQKTESAMGGLDVELEELKQSKKLIEEEIEKQKLINEDLDTQLSDARTELNEAYQKIPCLQSELEDKRNRCEELEARCLDLELQLESMTETDTSKTGMNVEEKQVQPESQITAASERLAQCQETILNLGKQFKALASPRDASLFDKVISTPTSTEDKSEPSPTSKLMSQRSSLLDQMLAEDDVDVDVEQLESPKTKEVICASDTKDLLRPQNDTSNSASDLNGVLEPAKEHLRIGPGETKHNGTGAGVGPLAIVPVKKQNGGLFRKLLWRKRKTHKKKMAALPWG